MFCRCMFRYARFIAGLLLFAAPAAAENVPVILRGKVVLPDGTPPTFRVAVERICSDGMGSAPGPLIDKNGDFIWRMDVDPMRTRACVIRATHAGYTSTTIDISALSGYLNNNITLETIVITSVTEDPHAIIISESKMPGGRAKSALKAANKALDEKNYAEARRQFQIAVEAAPKYAVGWHALGVLQEREQALNDARESYKNAIKNDPKMLPAYMTLSILCLRTKEWACASEAADGLIKEDKKRLYKEIHLHRAVALFGLRDLDRAAGSALEAIRLDPNHMKPRAEYVYGRILEAKGDIEGARARITRYLELDKNVPDPDAIGQHLQNLGKPDNPEAGPDLIYP